MFTQQVAKLQNSNFLALRQNYSIFEGLNESLE